MPNISGSDAPKANGSSPLEPESALGRFAAHTSDLVALCDLDGRLTYLNKAGRRMIGVTDADIFPLTLTDYVVPEDRHLVQDVILPQVRRQGIWEGTMRIASISSGTILDVERLTFAVRGRDDEVMGFCSIMRDVTERKAQTKRLEAQADLFYGLVANNPFGVYLIDADFRLREVSKGAQKVFSLVRPLLGRDFAEVLCQLWPEPFATEAIGHFRRTLETGESYEAPSTVEERADSGEREAYHWRIERIGLPDGRHGVVCYFYDLSERQRWAARLEEARSELRALNEDLEARIRTRTAALNQANAALVAEIDRREATQAALAQSQKLEALGQLTSGIAHDFNNILSAALAGFSLIQKRTDDPAIAQLARTGQEAAERGAKLVRQLMAFARQEPMVHAAFETGPLLDETRALLASVVRPDIELTCAWDADIWPILADPTQLQSALLNLATNAQDAMPAGGRLEIRARNLAWSPAAPLPAELEARGHVLITVSDDGSGIAPAVLQRIMEPFFTTKEVGKGTGLGLAMVHGMVRQAGGALRVESVLGEGSTFSLYLPRGELEARSAAETEGGAGKIARRSERILLVEDDAPLRSLVATGLREYGFDVVECADGQEALDRLSTHGVDVVLSDVRMPGLDGVDLARRIRASHPALPVLFMTAHADRDRLAGESVIDKPFAIEALVDRLLRFIDERDRLVVRAERLDRLQQRLHSDCTRSLFRHWREALPPNTMAPFAAFDPGACSEPQRIVVIEAILTRAPIEFRILSAGGTLTADAAGRALDLAVRGADDPATREAAYRRCVQSGWPSFEFARFALGDGETETFERLLVPYSADGLAIDRIVGAVVIGRQGGGR